MSSIDLFSMAVKNLIKRKLRSFLTILGVVIGASAIILMLSIGIGINESIDKSIESMGDITVITVISPNNENYFWMDEGSSSSQKNKNKVLLNDKAINEFKSMDNVIAVTPTIEMSLYALSGKYQSYMQVRGVDPSTLSDFGFEAEEGILLTGKTKNEVLMGKSIPYNFYNPNSRGNFYYMGGDMYDEPPPVDVFNDKIEASYDYNFMANEENPFDMEVEEENSRPSPKPIKLKVCGIIKAKSDYDENNYLNFMDIKEVQKLKQEQEKYEQSLSSGNKKKSSNEYDSALIKCSDIKYVEDIRQQLQSQGYRVTNAFDYVGEIKGISQSLQIFLGAIGGVSLFVAAIGIANTMIMAIYERTREIGVMKVIGASIKDIRRLFLLEASLIGLVGGILGVSLSLLLSFLVNNIGISFFQNIIYDPDAKLSVVPIWLVLLALIFSSLIGLISGYFPARRAMKLSALKAIKTE